MLSKLLGFGFSAAGMSESQHYRFNNMSRLLLRSTEIDDFALDSMDVVESRDAHEIITERHRAGSMIFTSNRGPDEWLTMFADPMRAQSAIDRLTGNAYSSKENLIGNDSNRTCCNNRHVHVPPLQRASRHKCAWTTFAALTHTDDVTAAEGRGE